MTQSAPTPPYRMTFLAHSPELVDQMKLALRGRFEQMNYEAVDFDNGPAKARACLEVAAKSSSATAARARPSAGPSAIRSWPSTARTWT